MNERILLIDDETSVRQMMLLALEHAGYRVATAPDAHRGLEMVRDEGPFALVLVDYRLPGMSGIEAIEAIRQLYPQQKIIFATAFGTIDLALEALRTGAIDFLRKPFSAETLRTAVRNALDKESTSHAAVPVGMLCRQFTRSAINGFSFEFDHELEGQPDGARAYLFQVNRDNETTPIEVGLPAYLQEYARAIGDAETLPGGHMFWQALAEEALADHLWQHVSLPLKGRLTVEDLTPGLRRWLDSVLTLDLAAEHAR
jgi:DNA-binding response OmpR family regulator